MANLNTNPLVFANAATGSQPGVLQLTNDLGGTYTAPVVSRVNGVAVSGSPTAGQVLTAGSGTTATWQTPAVGNGKTVTTATWAATLAPNGATTDIYRVTLAGTTAINNPSGSPAAGKTLQFELTQDGTGSRTVTWGNQYVFSTDIPQPTLTTGANKTDIIVFQFSAALTVWRCVGVIKGF